MAINLACPGCQGAFNLADDFAGKQVWCATCQQMIAVPMRTDPVPVAAVPPEVERVTAQVTRPYVPAAAPIPVEPVPATRRAVTDKPPRPEKRRSTVAPFALVGAGFFFGLAIGVCGGGGGTWLLLGRERQAANPLVVPPKDLAIAPGKPPMKVPPPWPAFDLTGTWIEPGGNVLAVRQINNDVWWMSKSPDNGLSFVAVFHGQLDGDKLTGHFADTPAGKNRYQGSLAATVIRRNGQVVAVEGELTFTPENRRARWSMSLMRK